MRSPDYHSSFSQWEDRSKAIDLFRLFAIMGVIFLHIKYVFSQDIVMEGLSSASGAVFSLPLTDQIAMFLREGLGRVASPALGLVSAWFLVKTLEEKTAQYAYVSRLKTLLTPYLFWNIAALAFFILIYYVFQRDDIDYQVTSWSGLVWDNILNPFAWPLNGPMHYYRDLLILALLYTFIHKFVAFRGKEKLFALLALLCPVLLANITQSGDWLGDNMHSILPRTDLTFYFLVGIATSSYYERIFSDKIVRILASPLVLVILCVTGFFASHIMYYQTEIASLDTTLTNISLLYFTLALRLLLSLLMFSFVLVIYMRSRFFLNRKSVSRIFCSHILLAYVLNGVMNNFIPEDYSLLSLILVFVTVIILGHITHLILTFMAKKTGWKMFDYI